jgi:hypothetical protein
MNVNFWLKQRSERFSAEPAYFGETLLDFAIERETPGFRFGEYDAPIDYHIELSGFSRTNLNSFRKPGLQ